MTRIALIKHALLLAAVGIPRFFPDASPRRVVRSVTRHWTP